MHLLTFNLTSQLIQGCQLTHLKSLLIYLNQWVRRISRQIGHFRHNKHLNFQRKRTKTNNMNILILLKYFLLCDSIFSIQDKNKNITPPTRHL